MTPKKMKLGFLLLLLSFSAFSQEEPIILSIKSSIEYASKNNSNIKIAQYDERIAQQRKNEVVGRGLPQANINGAFEDKLKVPLLVIPGGFGPGAGGTEGESTAIPMGYQYNSNLAGEVTQMILDPSFGIAVKGAKVNTLLNQQNTQKISEQVAYNIADTYYKAIVVQKRLQLLSSNLINTRKTLATTELQFKNGVAKQVDVNRFKVTVSNLESQVKQSETALEQAMNTLKFQMGMPLGQEVVLSDTVLTFNEEEAVVKEKGSNYHENRIEYKVLESNLKLQELDRKLNNSGYFPSLTAYGNYGYVAQGADFGLYKTSSNGWVDYTTSSIGLRLKIPLFDGLQRSARNQQSKLKVHQLEENINLTKQSVNLEVSNALSQYNNTLNRIEAEQQNVKLAEEVYQVTQLEFKEGVGTSTDVVEAETSLRQAQNTYINTLLDIYIARLNLEKSKGNLLNYLNSK